MTYPFLLEDYDGSREFGGQLDRCDWPAEREARDRRYAAYQQQQREATAWYRYAARVAEKGGTP